MDGNVSILASEYRELTRSEKTMSEDIGELAKALSKSQSEFSSLNKGEEGYGYKYTSLAATIEGVRPILATNGLSVSQLLMDSGKDDHISIKTILLHSSGQFISSVSSAPIPEMKGTSLIQRQGAGISYQRRYSLQAILNLATEDNDASPKGFEKPPTGTSFKKPAEKKVTAKVKKEEPKTETKKPSFRRQKKAASGDL